jgi:hypothetical protein
MLQPRLINIKDSWTTHGRFFFRRGIKNNTARRFAISRVQASDGRNFVFVSGFCFISGFSFVFLFAKAVLLQGYPRFKNLSSGCKSLELCADVASDVGIKAKSRLLRFL